jgi:uncharacterized protein (TIGR01777 family)
MATILVTGGTGLVGRALTRELTAKGHQCIVFTRKPGTSKGGIRFAAWDPAAGTLDEASLLEADYIIHLAGAGVADKRWSAARKKEILDSRVQSGQLLAQKLTSLPHKVKALISASAIGWYGADPVIPNARPFTENDPSDTAFLGDTCRQWEASLDSLEGSPVRVVKLRIGIVLSREGGALKEFLKPLQFGVAAVLGNGKQVVSWIHLDDLVNMFHFAINNDKLQGIYNATAPSPVSNRELTLTLAKAKKQFYIPMPVPAFVLKIMMGEMSIEVLKSATVSAAKIQAAGFVFQFPDIRTALEKEAQPR